MTASQAKQSFIGLVNHQKGINSLWANHFKDCDRDKGWIRNGELHPNASRPGSLSAGVSL